MTRDKFAKSYLAGVKFNSERGEFVLQRQRRLLYAARRETPIFKKFL